MKNIFLFLLYKIINDKFFLLSLFFILPFAIKAQLEVLDYPVELYYFGEDKREAFAVSNDTESEFAFIMADNKKVYAQLMDQNFQLLEKVAFDKPGRGYSKLAGYYYAEPYYNLIYTNKRKKKFHVVNIDFRNGKVSHQKVEKIKQKQEKWLAGFSYNKEFCFITITKGGSKINFYSISQSGDVKKKEVDLAPHLSAGSEPLYYQIFRNTNSVHLDDVSFIVPQMYENIRATSVKTKIYLNKNELLITNDKNPAFTSMFRINLKNYHVSHNVYNFSNIPGSEYVEINSNSFYYNDTLFQLKVSPAGMLLMARDLKNDSIISKMMVQKEEAIPFSNTPFIVSVEDKEHERYFTKTSKILRKISRHESGLSVYKSHDNFFITLGSYKPVPRGGGFLMGMSGSVVMGISFNINWTVNKDSYLEAVFDDELNHLQGRKYYDGINGGYEYVNIFDRIRHFEENLPGEKYATSLFWLNDKYYYGYYDQQDMHYHIYEFVEFPLIF